LLPLSVTHCTRLAFSTLVFFVLPTKGSTQTIDASRAVSILEPQIQNPLALALARCEAQAAIQGGYTVVIRLSGDATQDGQAKAVRVAAGRVSIGPDPTPLTSGLAKVQEKSGRVAIATKEVAFGRGLPFFIANVRMVTPESLTFLVHSNPALTLPEAFSRVEKTIGTFTGETVHSRTPFASTSEPQTRHATISPPLTSNVEAVLSIVTLEGGEVRCLRSNEEQLKLP